MENINNTNESGRERAEEALQKAAEVGWAFQEKTLYAVGTRVDPHSYKRSREAFEKRPFNDETLEGVKAAYAAERRHDYKVDGPSIHMTNDGYIATKPNSSGAPIAPWALGQLAQRLGAPGGSGSYLGGSPVAHRQDCLNFWANSAYAERGGKKSKHVEPISVKLRTRIDQATGKPAIYAALSPHYNTKFDYPKVAEVFVKMIGERFPESRGEFVTNGRKWRFRSLLHSAFQDNDVVVGDLVRGCIFVEGADDGSSSIRVGGEVEQARCINLTTIFAKQLENAIRHNQTTEALQKMLDTQITKAAVKITGFRDAWKKASTEQQLIEKAGDEGAEWVFSELVRQRLVWAVNDKPDELVNRLCLAWRLQPGYSKAHIVNAITRAAHTNPWTNPWSTETLEEQAGELLYNKVVIAPYEEKSAETNGMPVQAMQVPAERTGLLEIS